MTTMEQRYANAIKEIGGAAGLLALPEQVKEILKSETRLENKVKMLETVATWYRKRDDNLL